MRNKNIKLDFINDSRGVLFGISALLIIFFHMFSLDIFNILGVNLFSNLLYFIQKIGNCGVDIFLFLSGIGLYFSMSKNNIKTFYKNRFMRVVPTFIIALCIMKIFFKDMNIISVLLGVNFIFKGITTFWYIYLILFLYILFPLVYKIIKKYDKEGLFVLLLCIVLFNLIYLYIFSKGYFNIEIALTRIPVFLIGTYFGKIIYEKRTIKSFWIIVSMIVQLLLLVIIYLNLDISNFKFMVRYLYCILAITSVINISWLFSLIKNKNNFILRILGFVGSFSLELYLVHEKTFYLLEKLNVFSSYLSLYLVGFLISIVLAYLLKHFLLLSFGSFSKIKNCFVKEMGCKH